MKTKDWPKVYQLLLLIVISFFAVGAAWRQAGIREVLVSQPQLREVAEVIAVSGTVHSVLESKPAPEITAPVAQIFVQEGDEVKTGQPLARLADTLLKQQVHQAASSLRVAEVRLKLASRGPAESEYLQLEANSSQTVSLAQADLELAQQDLTLLRKGTRQEQMLQAQAETSRLQAEYRLRDSDFERQKKLFEDGVIAKSQLEQSETAKLTSHHQLEQSRARWQELENGARPEELEQAEAQVRKAKARLAGALGDQEAQRLRLQENPRPEDVELAAVQVTEARSNYDLALARLSQATVLAPFDGVVTKIYLDPGDTASPNISILEVVSSEKLEIRADVDSVDHIHLKLGQTVELLTENEVDEPFQATLSHLGSRFDTERGTREIRLSLEGERPGLSPGQTVDLNILKSAPAKRLILPLQAARSAGPRAEVYVLEEGRILQKEVRVGVVSPFGYPVQSGLEAEELVVLTPGSFSSGERVRGVRINEI